MSALCNVAQTEMKTLFENFVPGTTRLDEFYFNRLDKQREYVELWRVIKLILILSHGNAAVESGFSVNGDMLVENLHESSLVAQRTVFDSISYAGGVLGVSVDKRMMQYVRGARSRYDDTMKACKAAKAADDAKTASKRKIATEIKNLEAKKAKLAKDAASAVLGLDQEIKELRKLN